MAAVGTLADIKKLLDKPGKSSKMLALARIFTNFLEKNPYARKLLDPKQYQVIKDLSGGEEIFKYAFGQQDAAQLREDLRKHLKSPLPAELRAYVNNLISKVNEYVPEKVKPKEKAPSVAPTPGRKPPAKAPEEPKKPAKPGTPKPPKGPKAPKGPQVPEGPKPSKGPAKPEEEAHFEVKMPSEKRAPATGVLPGSVESLRKYLKKFKYQDLFHKLPPEVQSKLKKVQLEPESLFSVRKMAMDVVSSFLDRELSN